MSTPLLNCFTLGPLEASGVFLVGLFLHENHVTSQGHAAYCDSLAGLSVFSWLLEDNKRENDSSKRVGKDHKLFLSGDGVIVYSSLIERFSNDCRKTKTKATTPTNHNRSRQRDEPITITCNSLTAREKSRVHGTIGFGFASDWLKNWRVSFKPVTKRSSRNHVITFDSHLKTALIRSGCN